MGAMGILAFGRRAKITGKLAYHEFYRQSVQPLAAHLRRFGVDNQEDLEDIIQETYVQAHQSWDSLADPQAALAWLLTIGRRQLGRHLERKRRQPPRCSEAGRDAGAPEKVNELPDDRRSDAEAQLAAERLCAAVRRLHAAINVQRRPRALELFYFQETPLPEISVALGVNVSTLTTWLSRFRKEAKTAIATAPAPGDEDEGKGKSKDETGTGRPLADEKPIDVKTIRRSTA
jgi:RNA polymerase sigma-70 factor (ECF subfamily)